MAKTKCAYGKRGKSSIEWYKADGTPQLYCWGWVDSMTDKTIEECRSCPEHIDNAQKDLEKYNACITDKYSIKTRVSKYGQEKRRLSRSI